MKINPDQGTEKFAKTQGQTKSLFIFSILTSFSLIFSLTLCFRKFFRPYQTISLKLKAATTYLELKDPERY